MSTEDRGWLDVPALPDAYWEKRAHIERYQYATTQSYDGLVADAACGMGYGTRMLADAGHTAVGFDLDVDAIALARERYGPLEFHALDIQHATFARFGTLVSFETLEHLLDPWKFVDRLLVRQLICSVPIVPTKETNPHHRHDFTPPSFRDLVRQRFHVTDEWIQTAPDGTDLYMVLRGERKA